MGEAEPRVGEGGEGSSLDGVLCSKMTSGCFPSCGMDARVGPDSISPFHTVLSLLSFSATPPIEGGWDTI